MKEFERIETLLKNTDLDYVSLDKERIYLLKLRCQYQREFYQAREKLRVPKDKELTDFDRTIMNNAYCAEVQEKYELAKGFEEIVTDRLDYLRRLM